MHAEWIEVSKETIQQLLDHGGGKIIPVGTTSLRTIESLYWLGNKLINNTPIHWDGVAVEQWDPYETAPKASAADSLHVLLNYLEQNRLKKIITRTQILIAPGYTFRITSGLITNFHQPQSTLLLLVAALIGEDWRKVYDHALQHDFRFLSYGDGSLLWKK